MARVLCTVTVLHRSGNFVFGRVGHNIFANNVFEHFSTNTCQRDGPVVRSSMRSPFLKTGATLALTHSSGNFPVWTLDGVLESICQKRRYFLRIKF